MPPKNYQILFVLTFGLSLVFANPRADAGLLVTSLRSDEILEYDESTGDFVGVFASAVRPSGVTFGPDNNLYVTTSSVTSFTHNVQRFNGISGDFIDDFVAVGALFRPQHLEFGPDGNLYVSNFQTGSILRFDGQTGDFIDTFAGGNGLTGPTGLAFGPDGDLYVAGFSDGSGVFHFDGNSGDFIKRISLGQPNDSAIDVLFRGTDEMFVGLFGAGVDKFDVSGNLLNDPFAISNSMSTTAIEFGPDGNLYVARGRFNSVSRYDGETGQYIDEFVVQGLGGLDFAGSLAFSPRISSSVPEPASLAVFAMIPASLICWRRRR